MTKGLWRLGDLADRVDGEDGRAVVMVGQDVLVVSPVAAAILDLLIAGEQSTASLAESLEAAFGAPVDATSEALTTQVVQSLLEAGLVVAC